MFHTAIRKLNAFDTPKPRKPFDVPNLADIGIPVGDGVDGGERTLSQKEELVSPYEPSALELAMQRSKDANTALYKGFDGIYPTSSEFATRPYSSNLKKKIELLKSQYPTFNEARSRTLNLMTGANAVGSILSGLLGGAEGANMFGRTAADMGKVGLNYADDYWKKKTAIDKDIGDYQVQDATDRAKWDQSEALRVERNKQGYRDDMRTQLNQQALASSRIVDDERSNESLEIKKEDRAKAQSLAQNIVGNLPEGSFESALVQGMADKGQYKDLLTMNYFRNDDGSLDIQEFSTWLHLKEQAKYENDLARKVQIEAATADIADRARARWEGLRLSGIRTDNDTWRTQNPSPNTVYSTDARLGEHQATLTSNAQESRGKYDEYMSQFGEKDSKGNWKVTQPMDAEQIATARSLRTTAEAKEREARSIPAPTVSRNTVQYENRAINEGMLPTVQHLENNFGLRFSGGGRTEERNRAVGGVSNSHHLLKNGATAADFTGTKDQLEAGRNWAISNGYHALIHNAGSGTHLHVEVKKGRVPAPRPATTQVQTVAGTVERKVTPSGTDRASQNSSYYRSRNENLQGRGDWGRTIDQLHALHNNGIMGEQEYAGQIREIATYILNNYNGDKAERIKRLTGMNISEVKAVLGVK